jgi:HD-GYP domain-containing protein (c-di-GMP phosphodiesterase class II)
LSAKQEAITMALKKLRWGDIRPGIPLACDILDVDGRLLMRQGAVIDSPEQVQRLIQVGRILDASGGADASPSAAAEASNAGAAHGAGTVERVSSFQILDDVRAQLRTLLIPQPAEHEFSASLLELGRRLQTACQVDGDSALASLSVSRTMPYSIRQSCNVAVITELVCRQLDWVPEQRLSVVAAALTMNVSILALQDALYSHQGPLDATQRAAIDTHPSGGVSALRGAGVADDNWLSAVGQHHEAFDGSGYPGRIKGEDIMQSARILAIADRYCALISERGYREGTPADVALRKILVAYGPSLDPQLAARLVREVGIYPPGTAVELSNGELGIVVQRTADARQPIVRAVLNAQGSTLRDFPKRITSKSAFAVKAAVSRARLGAGFDPASLWHPAIAARDATDNQE